MLSKVSIGDSSYLGNDIFYPAHAKVGGNCLLATKVMIPLDGAVRENTGLLGSPCFEIPRVTRQDECFANLDETTRRTRIKQKNRSNILSAAGYLSLLWFYFLIMNLFAYCGVVVYQSYGTLGVMAVIAAAILASIKYFVITDRIGRGFRKLEPRACSMYEPYFWNMIERYWKVSYSELQRLFTGTPFKPAITRMLGARIGKKVFDDGLHLTEATLVEIGDYCTVNDATILQSHSLEEGVFKSDRIRIGKGCTIGCHAFVHYGVVMGDNAILDADSFLMKGEVLEPASIWRGNPAKARQGQKS
jgi:non-ribosomal peptide synthetase-like protein